VAVIQTAHFLAISADPSSLPSEFRLFSFGSNETSKGAFTLDEKGTVSIMAAYADQGVELAIDYEHQTFAAASNGKPAPAAGWFKPEARADGLWAVNVRWTDAAAEMLRAKEYRYFSPTFEVDKSNRITRLLPVALTNFPASKNQEPLIAARADGANSHTEIYMSNLNKIVGLKDDASDDAVTDRVIALAGIEHRILEATGKDTLADAMIVVLAAKDSAVELQQLKKTVRDWEERHQHELAEEKANQIESVLQGALLEGRVSLKDTERLDRWRKHGDDFGVDSLKKLVAERDPRPVRVYQAPVFENTEESRMKAIRDYQKSHPDMSFQDAYVALAAERPSLFDGGR
jgi:phage I-like protein